MRISRTLVAPSIASAAAALALIPASGLAAGELVTRADGPEGEAFDGSLSAVSADGRYVLIDGPIRYAASEQYGTTLYVRDRETDTLTPAAREDGELGRVFITAGEQSVLGLDVSDDGQRVLFLLQQGEKRRLFVRDLAARTTTAVSTDQDGATGNARGWAGFINGGSAVVYGLEQAGGESAVFERSLTSGTTALRVANAIPSSATENGDTITWSRAISSPRPTTSLGPRWPEAYPGTVLGYSVRGGASRVVATSAVQEWPAAPVNCAGVGPTTQITSADGLKIDGSGRYLWYSTTSRSSSYQGQSTTIHYARPTQSDTAFRQVAYSGWGPGVRPLYGGALGARGEHALFWGPVGYSPGNLLQPRRASEELPAAELPPLGSAGEESNIRNAKFFAQDRGIVLDQQISSAARPSGVYAYDPDGPVPAPLPTVAPIANAADRADDGTVRPAVTWATCPEPVIPTVADYASIDVPRQPTTRRSAGTVRLQFRPSRSFLLPPAKQATVTIKTLGFTTWQRTVATTSDVTLPRPSWLLPQTVTVKVSTYQSEPSAPTEFTLSRSWIAYY